jgi:hypothetical protein
MKPFTNVAEGAPLYDSVIICSHMYGKELSVGGWYTSFAGFAANSIHTFFKSRTEGSTHLAYCNMQSADNVDTPFIAYTFGVRFFAPVSPDCFDFRLVSPQGCIENMPAWWLWDLPKHCGVDFRVQQDVVIENTCLASPSGYGPRGGGGAQPATDTRMSGGAHVANTIPWKVAIGTIGDPSIDNRFPLPEPIKIARNTSIEANLYVSDYARFCLNQMAGPLDNVMLTECQATTTPVDTDYLYVPTRYGIQISLYGYREVQQRGQYFAPGAIVSQG